MPDTETQADKHINEKYPFRYVGCEERVAIGIPKLRERTNSH